MSTFHAAASGAHNRSQAVAAQLLSGLPGLDLITFVCFQIDFGVARTGFAYVVVIALVSLLGSFNASVGLSILGVGSLSYFFAPPSFEFRVDAPNDVVRIAFFLTTSLVVADLTTRVKRTKKQLGESKAALGEAQRIAHVGWWERDFGMGHVTLSDEACRIFGVQRVDLPDWHGLWLELIHPDDRERAEAPGAALVPGGPRCGVEYRSVRPDGTQRVVRSQEDVAGDDSGRPLRQFGVMQNITELRDAEHELRASETRFRTLVDHASDAFFLYNEDATGTRELSISTEPGQAGGILVALRDSGPRIEPEHRNRIFEPFYTTKTSGIGMGLSICRSIIDAHVDRLWTDANQPRGAVFRFTLPARHFQLNMS